jgi:hypothetical protein
MISSTAASAEPRSVTAISCGQWSSSGVACSGVGVGVPEGRLGALADQRVAAVGHHGAVLSF